MDKRQSRLHKPIVDKVSINDIDAALASMIENDKVIIPQYGISPRIWRCKWYCIPLTDRNKQRLLYQKGDAVWINTEDLSEFTKSNRQFIENVINNSSLLRSKYNSFENNEYQKFEFCKQIVNGDVTDSPQGLPLFYLGDIRKNTQIRISLCDNNDKLPNNDGYWKDLFVNNDKAKFQSELLNRAKELCKTYLEQHLIEYHLSGYNQTLSTEYLLNDMSNLGHTYEFINAEHGSSRGFDYVVHYDCKKFSNGSYKWYRVWSSGMLEHGGIVTTTNPGQAGDSLIDENTHYKVNLNWPCSSGTAPSYRYPMSSNGFYFDGSSITIGTNTSNMNDMGRQLSQEDHYVVQLTPIVGNTVPYSYLNGGNTPYYMSNDINRMTNSSFCFLINKESTTYSYHVQGFVTNLQQQYK